MTAVDPHQATGGSDATPEPADRGPLRLGVLIAILVSLAVWQGWRLLAVIGAIVVMIFLHELGHFVMARRAGEYVMFTMLVMSGAARPG